jgi:hypothetical protein
MINTMTVKNGLAPLRHKNFGSRGDLALACVIEVI